MNQEQSMLEYNKYGQGFPVVLLHGFGEDNTIWNNQIVVLKDHCQLIIPNLQGTGSSPLMKDKSSLSIEDMADDIQLLLEKEKITQCILLGHSMGGYITLAFAEKYPQYLKGFGLIHSTAYPDSEEKKNNRLRSIDIIEEYGGYSFLKNTIPNLFSVRFKFNNEESVEELIQKSKTFSNTSLQAYCHAMMTRPARTQQLINTSIPVLLIAGTEDIAAPLKDLKEQSLLSTMIEFHILERVGHMGMWEAPQEINQLVLSFIKKCVSYN
jgi:pimeloyl-ACP methyl ester carboxylesterase